MFRAAKAVGSSPRRVRRLVIGLLALIAFLAVGVGLAPTIVARSALRNRIARDIFSDLDGELSIGSASLGWFAPVVLHDVELRDRQGRVLLFAKRITSGKSLLDLLNDTAAPGSFRCDGAELHVVSEKQRTNVEDVFACWIEPKPGGGDPLDGIGLELVIADGAIDLDDQDGKRRWQVEHFNLDLALPRKWTSPMTVKADGKLSEASNAKQPSSAPIAVDLEYGLLEQAGKLTGTGRVKLDLDKVPACFAELVLARGDTHLKLAGLVGGHAELSWGQALHIEGKLAGDRVCVAGGPLGRDQLELGQLTVPFKIDNAGNLWTFADTGFNCDVGSATLTGSIDLEHSLLHAVKNARGDLRAHVDFARLAAMLPRTMHLQEGLTVKSGKVDVALAGKPAASGLAWTGSVKTSDLQAEVNGLPMSWPEPIAIDFATRETATELVVDNLQIRSDFLKLDARGTPANFNGQASFDLDKLMMAVTRFVDVGSLICTGAGEATLAFRHDDAGKFTGQAACSVRGFGLSGWSLRPWREQQLSARLDATGRLVPIAKVPDAPVDVFLDQALVQITAGETWAEAKLIEPVEVPRFVPLACTVKARGDLNAWKERLRPWTTALDDIQLGGASELSGIVHRTGLVYRIENALLNVNDLRVRDHAHDILIAEPTAELRLNGSYQDGLLQLENSELRMATANVQAKQARLHVPVSGPMTSTGTATIQGNVPRILRVLQPATITPLSGDVNGQVAWQWNGPLEFQTDLIGKNLAYGPPNKPSWQEAAPHVVCHGSYDAGSDALTVRRLDVQSTLLGGTAQGSINKLSTRRELLLTGKVQYDLQQVNHYLQPRLGKQVTLVGKDTRPFRLEGALTTANVSPVGGGPRVTLGPPTVKGQPAAPGMNLKGDASLALQSANIYGFQLGALTADAHLEDGWLRFQPLVSTLNQGKLNMTPTVRLEPTELYVAKGRVLDKVRITPQMCAGGLGFIAPALANALEPQGSFSVDLDSARVPLDDANSAAVTGRLSVHQLQVNSSPLIGELGTLFGLPGTVQVKQESVVPFKVAGGRVHHENLELLFGNVVIKTSGSVGMDGSLALSASMPIPRKMLGTGTVAAAFANRTIVVPIRGTLDKPKLDERALLQESQKILRDSARDLLKEEAEKGLKKLLGQ